VGGLSIVVTDVTHGNTRPRKGETNCAKPGLYQRGPCRGDCATIIGTQPLASESAFFHFSPQFKFRSPARIAPPFLLSISRSRRHRRWPPGSNRPRALC